MVACAGGARARCLWEGAGLLSTAVLLVVRMSLVVAGKAMLARHCNTCEHSSEPAAFECYRPCPGALLASAKASARIGWASVIENARTAGELWNANALEVIVSQTRQVTRGKMRTKARGRGGSVLKRNHCRFRQSACGLSLSVSNGYRHGEAHVVLGQWNLLVARPRCERDIPPCTEVKVGIP